MLAIRARNEHSFDGYEYDRWTLEDGDDPSQKLRDGLVVTTVESLDDPKLRPFGFVNPEAFVPHPIEDTPAAAPEPAATAAKKG